MAAFTAMNSSNILGEVLKFATAPIPKMCEMCNRLNQQVTSPLHLLKTISCSGLVKNKYLCMWCWCSNLPSDITRDVAASIRTLANPEWDEKKKKSFVKKEWKLITSGEYLFQRHRLKRTQAKADFYEKEIYKSLRSWLKNKQEEIKKKTLSLIDHTKKRLCFLNSSNWIKEINTQRFVKWYIEKKIKYETLQRILSLLTTYVSVDWNDILLIYNANKRVEPTLPPLPSWFEDM
jgi:hypothetical protein